MAALILLATASVSAFANSTQKADPFTDGGLAGKSAPYGEQGKLGQPDPFTDGA